MKKIFYTLIAASMAVVACQKQSVEPMYSVEETGHGSYIFTIKAINDAGPAVKSDYDADGKFSWSAGDAISVLFHNGSENKFFTLTTSDTGKSATFSGEITSGYEIGASDGTVSDKKVWALFPASENHTYTAGGNPSFYVQPEVDFSATHFSANIPMYALVADVESGLSFANLACAYKFIIENIDASVSKVRLDISNQTTYGLSGSWPIHADKYINYDWATPGSAKSCLSYTCNVTASKAVFYVSTRYWGKFQPIIKIYNAGNGSLLKTVTASAEKQPTNMSVVQPITIDLSDGDYFTPAINIDGDMSDWAAISGTSNGNHTLFKATSDERYVYFYSYRSSSTSRYGEIWGTKVGYIYIALDLDNDMTTGAGEVAGNGPYEFIGYIHPYAGTTAEPAIATSDIPQTTSPSPYTLSNISCSGAVDGDGVAIEFSIPRSDLPTIPGTSITVYSWGNKDLSKVTLSCTL